MPGLAEARSCRARWASDEGRDKVKKVLGLLQEKEISGIRDVVGVYVDRIDLRGFPFPPPISRGESVRVGETNFELIRNRTEINRVSLSAIDLSYATLSGTSWRMCIFDDCVMNGTVLAGTRFWACEIVDCAFTDSDLRGCLLSGHLGRNPGRIHNVSFSNGRFSEVYFSFPQITNCTFACDVTNVDFDGSRFSDCRFTGKLEKVAFRKRPTDSRLARLISENKMNQVDFSKANLDDVDFRGGVPLTNCIFPNKPGAFLILNGSRVFAEVRRRIESVWDGEDKKMAIGFTVNYFLDRVKEGQRHFLVDEESFSEYWGGALAHRYSSLIREVADGLGYIKDLHSQSKSSSSDGR